ncbi:hypothetical protein EPN95_04445 [Patescibacteria group bacterium]|nr:MAG: hypothetical protein EPN95_04445 [Patescibacteria group bacterium]
MEKSESIKELSVALAKAQAEMEPAKKESENPFYRSKYSDLASVLNASRKALSKHGLSVIQPVEMEGDFYFIETVLLHESGEWISSRLKITPMKQVKESGWAPSPDPQSIGVAISYGRRYAYQAMICGAAEDDDGNQASGLEKETNEELDKEVERGDQSVCPCGEKLNEKSIAYYAAHPTYEPLCFACSTRKKNKAPYGFNRPKDRSAEGA